MAGLSYAGMAIGMVLFWVLVIGGIIVLVRFANAGQARRYTAPTVPSDAKQLLALHFARGEVDDKEYRDKLAVLGDDTAI